MKIEIIQGYGDDHRYANHPLAHRTPFHFWGSPYGIEYPYVVEVSEEEWERIKAAFEEYRWVQRRLRELISDLPVPNACGCGNCIV